MFSNIISRQLTKSIKVKLNTSIFYKCVLKYLKNFWLITLQTKMQATVIKIAYFQKFYFSLSQS